MSFKHIRQEKIAADPHGSIQNSLKTGLSVNITLVALQIGMGLWTQSQALIADGLHTLSDLLGDAILLFATQKSQRPADAGHPYGHKRYENVAALALGVILLLFALAMIASALGKIINPETSARVLYAPALVAAAITLLVKEGLFRYLLYVGKKAGSTLLIANAWHARSDAASSLVVAIGLLGNWAGLASMDAIAALFVGLLIGRMGLGFAYQAFQDLIDGAADEQTLQQIRQIIRSQAGVMDFHRLRTRKVADEVIVDVDIDIDAQLCLVDAHHIAYLLRQALLEKAAVFEVMVHMDPLWIDDNGHIYRGEAAYLALQHAGYTQPSTPTDGE